MKRHIITSAVLLAMCLTMPAYGRHTVVTGSAVHSESHKIAVGEPLTGTLGDTTDWHVTSGQIQGLSNLGVVTSSDDLTFVSEGYKVYPNPVVDNLTISRPEASNATLTVNALSGTLLLTAPLTEQTSTINLSALEPGIYVLLITPADGTTAHTAKIMKQ